MGVFGVWVLGVTAWHVWHATLPHAMTMWAVLGINAGWRCSRTLDSNAGHLGRGGGTEAPIGSAILELIEEIIPGEADVLPLRASHPEERPCHAAGAQ
jgi:hypothetical protein